MKLKQVEHQKDYQFLVTFENGKISLVDLADLISSHVSKKEVTTAQINHQLGCIEFKNGKVDIDPDTFYRYVCENATRVH